MKQMQFTGKVLILFVCLWIGWAAQALGAKHALLIGINTYPGLNVRGQLEGPVNDVRELERILTTRFGFSPSNVVTLTEAAATRDAIMAQLNALKGKAGSGDFVFFYFSGHGTSSYDPNTKVLGLSPYTGALVPADIRTDGNDAVNQMMKTLIVGSRDIRPVIENLERRGAEVFAAFDACYSGYAVRALMKPGKSKFADLGLGPALAYDAPSRKEPPYPYRQTIYLSAASDREEANDITSWDIRQGIRTIDGKPHGALTNALLQGLSGQGDTNRDGTVTYRELHQYVQGWVSESFPHTPQLLFPKDREYLLDQPVLKAVKASATPGPISTPADSNLWVKVEIKDPQVKQMITGIPGVKIADRTYDLLLTDQPGIRGVVRKRNYFLFLKNGELLTEVPREELRDRLVRQVRVKELVGFTYPRQNFNVYVDLIGQKGVLLEGEDVGFNLRAEADGYFLLLNIDSTGLVNIIYPYYADELNLIPASRGLQRPNLGTVKAPNFGTEYIKVFAFKQRPADLHRFLETDGLSPHDPRFDRLLQMVRTAGDAAQATLMVKTTAKGPAS